MIPYQPAMIWDYSNYFGPGLKALELLGREKGYCLVGCNYTGVTAFFVRDDLAGNHFAEPFTAENHYESPRYYTRMPNGHPPGFGPLDEHPTHREIASDCTTFEDELTAVSKYAYSDTKMRKQS